MLIFLGLESYVNFFGEGDRSNRTLLYRECVRASGKPVSEYYQNSVQSAKQAKEKDQGGKPMRLHRMLFLSGVLVTAVAILISGIALAGPNDNQLITPTKAHYAPTDNAVILGFEFEAYQTVNIDITDPSGSTHSGTVMTDGQGSFSYTYPGSLGEGLYDVQTNDPLTGNNLSTTFADPVNTDLELVGMPDCALNPARGSSSDGLVDACAGKCLVGTVDLKATGGSMLEGFTFDLIVDRLSDQQPASDPARAFINQLETVSTSGTADPDTGSAVAPGGLFYTTSGNSVIGDGDVLTSLDGSMFSISGPTTLNAQQDKYEVTVQSASSDDIRFEYCARIDPNAGDGDNGNDGTITSDPETGGTETQPINVINPNQPPDTDPPICELVGIDRNDPVTLTVRVEDPDSGLKSIEVTEAVNIVLPIDLPDLPDNPPSNAEFRIDAVKDDQTKSSRVGFLVCDAEDNCTACDPVDINLERESGQVMPTVIPDLDESEGHVRVTNGTVVGENVCAGGVSSLLIDVNGKVFTVAGLKDGAKRDVDVSSAMVSGSNTFTLTPVGPPGTCTNVFISDGNFSGDL
jgi:hypothetical protein